jgi:huntingtin interacting protein 1
MLSKSRAADSGIKLEVNEKILDSCTNLMQAIRVLVQKSRLLQAEIVAQGKVSSCLYARSRPGGNSSQKIYVC